MTIVDARPLTQRCAKIYAAGEHALLGVSALNGFFSVPNLTGLLGWAVGRFGRVDVLVPGIELAGTLVARGYERPRARKKAREEINNTRNRVARALEALGRPPVGVFSWTDLYGEPAYERARREIGECYEADQSFRSRCRQALEPVLHQGEQAAEQVAEALPFLLAELPLVLDSPAVLGVPTSSFCYPRLMPMAEWLFSGSMGISPSAGQAILTTRLTPVVAGEDHCRGVG
ncbi:tRNA-dependent cyclodipeptide synthase [Nonomuraea sp. NPDC050310]|uniref:tRNA-dependent cyclodipeptide synthase n=1 Tax=Nonomuraea sp. NPDC050310 TaxID=3154935 RepID=UPI0033CEA5B7